MKLGKLVKYFFEVYSFLPSVYSVGVMESIFTNVYKTLCTDLNMVLYLKSDLFVKKVMVQYLNTYCHWQSTLSVSCDKKSTVMTTRTAICNIMKIEHKYYWN